MANIITAGNSTNGGTSVTTDTSGTLNIVTGSGSGATAIAVDTSQNVGIGTTAPNYKVTVNSSSTNSYQQLTNSVTGSASGDGFLVGIDSLEAIVWNLENSNIKFATNNTERMRIDSSGNLLVGTASLVGASGSCFTGAFSGSASKRGLTLNDTDATSGSQTQVGFFRNASNTGTITCTNTATAYNTSSDYRLKENVQPMVSALNKVAQLKPVTYKWKVDGSDGEGFIAHELQAVVPDCVTGEKDAVNEDGSIKPQAIDTSFLIATLTAAIQELKAELDAVKAKVGV